MWPEMTCTVHILADTIRTSLLLRFSFCFAPLEQGRQFEFLFFCTQTSAQMFRYNIFGIFLRSQILLIAHIFSKFQTIKTLRRYSEIMSWPDIVL